MAEVDLQLCAIARERPETEALLDLFGVGMFTALLVVGEIGDPERFANGGQVGAYAGLTARVHRSGGHEYGGHISRQGSPWLRWALVQAAMKLVRRDEKLREFYARVRRREDSASGGGEKTREDMPGETAPLAQRTPADGGIRG